MNADMFLGEEDGESSEDEREENGEVCVCVCVCVCEKERGERGSDDLCV